MWLNRTSPQLGVHPARFYAFDPFGTWVLFTEIVVLGLVPALLLAVPRTRRNPRVLVAAAAFACAGVVMNRFVMTVQTLALPTLAFDPFLSYVPSWQEAASFGAVRRLRRHPLLPLVPLPGPLPARAGAGAVGGCRCSPGRPSSRGTLPHVLFFGALYSVVATIAATLAVAAARSARDARRGLSGSLVWHADFEDLPASVRACRHQLTGEAPGRLCESGFDCRGCREHRDFDAARQASGTPPPVPAAVRPRDAARPLLPPRAHVGPSAGRRHRPRGRRRDRRAARRARGRGGAAGAGRGGPRERAARARRLARPRRPAPLAGRRHRGRGATRRRTVHAARRPRPGCSTCGTCSPARRRGSGPCESWSGCRPRAAARPASPSPTAASWSRTWAPRSRPSASRPSSATCSSSPDSASERRRGSPARATATGPGEVPGSSPSTRRRSVCDCRPGADGYGYRGISYFLIFSYRVERSMPRASAAALTLPRVRWSVAAMYCCSRSWSVRPAGSRRPSARGVAARTEEGEVLGGEDAGLAADERALDRVLQLAHVAGPVVVHQHAQRLVRDPGDGAAELVREPVEELLREERHVLAPLTQGRDPDVDHVQTVEEVLAEAPLARRRPRGRGGWRRSTRTSTCHLLGPAHPEEAPLLKHAQEVDLQLRRDVADLVEEDRAPVGQLELALLLRGGAGEGPLLVAEQLRLEQRLGERRAGHGHERPRRRGRPSSGSRGRPAPCPSRSRPG